MRIGLIAASGGSFPVDGRTVAAIARRAEEVGFDSIWVGEHVVMSDHERYPRAAERRVGPSPASVLPDPIEWLSYVAACTEHLLLGTAIFLLALHSPAVTAKRIATLDQLSGGRVRLGIGLGWSRHEFETVGVPFDSRGRRADEAIDAIRCLWRDSPATFVGDHVRFDGVSCLPKPLQGAVPILVGGDSDAAARRAGARGDGYLPFGKDPDEVARLVGVMRAAARAAGRDPDDVELTGLGSTRPEAVGRLAELGFTRVNLFLPDPTPAGVEQLWDKLRAVREHVGV